MTPNPETGEDGTFRLGPLPPGTFRISGHRTDDAPAGFGEVTLVAHQELLVGDARLRHGALLQLGVSGTPEQLEGLEVRVLDGDGRSVGRGRGRKDRVLPTSSSRSPCRHPALTRLRAPTP